MRILGKTNIDFMRGRRIWYGVSIAVILLGITSLVMKGFDLGIDFLGGTELIVHFKEPVAIGDVREALGKIGFGGAEIKTFGSDQDILIRTPVQGEGGSVSDQLQSGIKSAFATNPYEILRNDKIGPKIGAELRRDAVYAIIASLIAIWFYIWLRFKFVYGFGAVVALFHDVLVTLGMVSIFDGILNLQIDQNMVAAFLTIVGTSINDTVVIFDRIRENQKIFKTMPLKDLMNKSINETLSRTIITNGSIFTVLLILLIFGGEVNRGFAFAMTVGSIVGTYSTVYIASSIVLEVVNRGKSQGQFT